jgi:hypothetical protein
MWFFVPFDARLIEQIEDLKLASIADDEADHTTALDIEPNDDHSRVLISQAASLTKEEVLQSIPPKEISDKLLWHFFNSGSPALRMWAIP